MPSKILIAIVNCHARENWANAIRETWKPLVQGADILFFRGQPWQVHIPAQPDVVQLNCDDSYAGLPEKVRAIMRWAHDHGYEHVLKCDDDVVLNPAELLSSGFEKHRYSGKLNRRGIPAVPFGFNYWLDRQCMEIISKAELPIDNDDEKWVAETLYKHGIDLVDVPRYALHYGTLIDRSQENYAYRPLNKKAKEYEAPGIFSWAIFLTSHGDSKVSSGEKIAEFHRVFVSKVGSKVTKSIELAKPSLL